MNAMGSAGILVAAMAVVTMLTRFLPFIAFRKKTPPYVAYLGKMLPSAIIGMLVVYCLKDVTLNAAPFGLYELAASACVVLLQIWKRNALVSILAGTVVYMLLLQLGETALFTAGGPLFFS